ncbi:unknown [Eggerthella sp. CAG:298]|nr:unknown [Eggerthella sp. CAG:298]
MTLVLVSFCLALQFASHSAPRLRPSIIGELVDITNTLERFTHISHTGVNETQDMLSDRIGQYVIVEFDLGPVFTALCQGRPLIVSPR